MGKEEIKITLNQAAIETVIIEHVLTKYGPTLGISTVAELEWNDYSLMAGSAGDGLWFTKKIPTSSNK